MGGCSRAFAVVGTGTRWVRFARVRLSSEVQRRMCGGRRWRRWGLVTMVRLFSSIAGRGGLLRWTWLEGLGQRCGGVTLQTWWSF